MDKLYSHTSNNILDVVLVFFHNFLNQEPVTSDKITQFKGEIFLGHETDTLIFNLSALHSFLFDSQQIHFSAFKKALYKGEFNKKLQALGGVVSVYQSIGKIDANLYKLSALVNKHA